MANADQLKALLKSHFDGDSARLHAVAMQVAAREAKRSHGKLAEDIRALVNQVKLSPAKPTDRKTVPITQPRGDLADILAVSHPKLRLADMTLSAELASQLQRLLSSPVV